MSKPVWNLMMKTFTKIGAYQVEDFRFNILYTDPSPLNYITEVKDAGNPILSGPDPSKNT
jgi:cell surface protein SprA